MPMCFSIILLLCVLDVSFTTDNVAYYSPGFPLTWFEAETYCTTQCNSNLATIHYSNETTFIVDSLSDYKSYTNIDDIWIGLHKPDTDALYEWVENTNNTFYDYDSSTWTHDCIYLSLIDNQLHDASCDTISTFVCNSCHNIINKYVLTSKEKITQYEADALCEREHGTFLGSIHSQSDYEETIGLCKIYGNYSCWIGLQYLVLDHVWKWADGTTLDYGSNIGEYPWNNEPMDGEDCVRIYFNGSQWNWNAAECGNNFTTSYPLCNMPSELCNYHELYLETGNSYINFECYYNGDDLMNFSTVLFAGERWINSESLNIEFMFTISKVYSNDIGYGAIVLSESTDSGCLYFYIGVVITDSNPELYLEFAQTHFYRSIPFNISSEYYLLRVSASLTDSYITQVNVTVNNLISLSYVFGDFRMKNQHIGMFAQNVAMYGKYLFVSGSKRNYSDADNCGLGNDSVYGVPGVIVLLAIICILGVVCCVCICICFGKMNSDSRKMKAKIHSIQENQKDTQELLARQISTVKNQKIQELQDQVVQLQAMTQPGSKKLAEEKHVETEDSATYVGEGVPVNVYEAEGYEKPTKIESATRLDICTKDGGNTGTVSGADGKGVMDTMLADEKKDAHAALLSYSKCIQCGSKSKQNVNGIFVCTLCKRLDNAESDKIVDEMYIENIKRQESEETTTKGTPTLFI